MRLPNWNNNVRRLSRIGRLGLMLSVIPLLMICAGSHCSAQSAGVGGRGSGIGEETAKVIEALPDGGYVVEIGGVRYRAVTDEQLRQIQERKIQLTACEQTQTLSDQEIEKLKTSLALAVKDAQLAMAQATIERERAGRYEALFQGEHNLRLQAEALAPRGRVSRFFDMPAVQFAIKLGLPVLNLTLRR
jgi:hypothetical protein